MSHDKINRPAGAQAQQWKKFCYPPCPPLKIFRFHTTLALGGTGTQVRLRHVKDLLENACVSLPPFSCENIPVRSGFPRLNQY